MAVEISESGSLIYDRDHKTPAYLALGVREVWRVDLKDQSAFVSRTGQPEMRVPEQITWHPPELAEPLLLSVPSLFPGARDA